ncbi:hypothetical protein DFJ77DRAFT_6416 [Powellomyces hirtus]|nr:hypothetical protein DFJ77DRAFT_6416 [Powellomyces hirtus]
MQSHPVGWIPTQQQLPYAYPYPLPTVPSNIPSLNPHEEFAFLNDVPFAQTSAPTNRHHVHPQNRQYTYAGGSVGQPLINFDPPSYSSSAVTYPSSIAGVTGPLSSRDGFPKPSFLAMLGADNTSSSALRSHPIPHSAIQIPSPAPSTDQSRPPIALSCNKDSTSVITFTSTDTTAKSSRSVNETLEGQIFCKKCKSCIATVLAFNTVTSQHISEAYAVDMVCDACQALDRRGSSSLKRGARPDLDCYLCARRIGAGGLVGKDRTVIGATGKSEHGSGTSEKPTVDSYGYLKSGAYPLEWVCAACHKDFRLCTACGGGGRYRSGKWRPKALFEDRKSCTLSHVRYKKESEFSIHDMELEGHLLNDILTDCGVTFRDFWYSMLMTPKVLSGKGEAGINLIKDVVTEWWNSLRTALTKRDTLPEGKRLYLACAWKEEAKKAKSKIKTDPNLSMKERGWLLHGYHIFEWNIQQRSVQLGSTTFRQMSAESFLTVIDTCVVGLYKLYAQCKGDHTQWPTHMWRHGRPSLVPAADKLIREHGFMTKQDLARYPLDPAFLEQTRNAVDENSLWRELGSHATNRLTLQMWQLPTEPPHMASPPTTLDASNPQLVNGLLKVHTLHKCIDSKSVNTETCRIKTIHEMPGGWFRGSMALDGYVPGKHTLRFGENGPFFIPLE